MSDRVRIVHPSFPGKVAEVSVSAFERRSSGLGWVLADDQPVQAPAAPVYRVNRPDPGTDDTEPIASTDEIDVREALRTALSARGVTPDGRWGVKRLRTELAALGDGG